MGPFSANIVPNIVLQSVDVWRGKSTLAFTLLSIFFQLTGPPRRVSSSVFPWKTATNIAQDLLCCLKNLAASAEKQSSLLCLHLSTLFFSFPDVALAPLLFWSPKHAFRLHPDLQRASYFSLRKKGLPFISEIITQQQHEGRLLIRWLPDSRHMYEGMLHSRKFISENGLPLDRHCVQLKLLYSGVLCYFL